MFIYLLFQSWHDQCSRAKQKKCSINLHRRKTGGGEQAQDRLTQFEEKIVELVGEAPIEGQPNTSESLVINFLSENNEDISADDHVEDICHTKPVMIETAAPEAVELEPNFSENWQTPNVQSSKRRRVSTQRVDASTKASYLLVEEMRKKNNIKEKYYEKKLILLERKVEATEKYYAQKMEYIKGRKYIFLIIYQ